TRSAVASSFPAGSLQSMDQWILGHTGGGQSSVVGGALTMTGGAIGGTAAVSAGTLIGSPGVEHALRITLGTAPINLRIGTAPFLGDIMPTTVLGTGTHSLTFTPNGPAYVTFESLSPLNSTIAAVGIEGGGPLELPTPYSEARLPFLRSEQSGDV